ncbi:MAG TPA: copper amine oxidase N-terminal domain-containing protein [Candidatus Agathobaculum intestinipullorum]|nr:copper amine oxidase N-terminal domain-containing protein [Candidatus Agathobaculum intestinipullorum]
MKKTHRFLACTVAAILTFGMPAQAFEPALDPLPDLSSYPTQLLLDGQAVKQGAMPRYIEGTAQLPLRNILEQAGYKVDWNAQNQSAVFSKNDMETYRLSSATGALTQDETVLWTDSKITVAKGTTYVSANLFDYVEGIKAAWDGATNTAIITTEAPRDNVYCYDLGEGTLTQGTREIPYRMQGVIGVPEGQNRPVVIFLHGAHPIQSAAENRYDLGFSYLVDQLADAGYLALSMNVGINYSFENGEPNGCQRTVQVVEQQSALLKQAIEGKNGIFPCDLKNKGDLNQVILVGHSRAGYDIFEVADQTELLGIQGLISAAPSLVSPLSGAPVDVPAGIIIPQYDGDVTSLDGGTLFDQLENTSQRSSGTDLIYLENGNHGGFSTALVRPDPFADRDTLPLVMEPEKQQAFFSAYVMDFVKTVLATGKTPLETVASLPEQYAGYPIMARVDAGGDVLYRAAVDSVENLKTTDAVVEAVNACSTLDHTAGSFRIPGSFMQYDLTRIRWEKAGSTVTVPVSADLRQASYLQMVLAQDSGDERNRQQDQSMSVTLRDAKGRESSMKISAGTPALTWQEGTVESIPVTGEDSFLQYSTFTPLGSVRLNPEDFNGVDLGQITQIVLTFDQPSGSIMLREVQLVE